MKRKLIKQGKGGFTVYLPKKWVDQKGLKGGEEITVEETEDSITIRPEEIKKEAKTISITLESGKDLYKIYRNYIGALYREGYDIIKVKFDDSSVIPALQKTVDTLYGFEIFDISDKSCVIKSVYKEDDIEVASHVNKMIHIIKSMQNIIKDDINKQKYPSETEIYELRNLILKQRDVIARTILQKRLMEEHGFLLNVFNLWNIAKIYSHLYRFLTKKPKLSQENYKFLEKVNDFFTYSFDLSMRTKLIEKHKAYDKLKQEGIALMQDKRHASLLTSYCMNLLILLQTSNSHMLK